ncbi:MAG: F0F1 ATP synthase subunit A [Acidimicrobiia bacterium]|nr:F0F1 ATP synthase subunit A [Acidimicrobiia bacterium]NND12495.1 F0F1 ATP synthase subunit A [Acidimicrobiia bacterium]NNL29033.1 F0F1 ATP synthase subunit A [Acidimicrobiia bacterium]
MGELVAFECDTATDVVCQPPTVNELFELPTLFSIGDVEITRQIAYFFLATLVVAAILYFGLRKPKAVPGKFQLIVEELVAFVRDGIAKDIIGPEGTKYVPYLLSIFLFILVGNFFEITPFINYPITSRMAIPALLAIMTYLIFVFMGFRKNGLSYLTGIIWPKSVPVAMRPLVGIIEFFSTFAIRPLTLAVRLFANLVAGHVMLSLLLVTGFTYLFVQPFDFTFNPLWGVLWFLLGIAIFVFEMVVAFLQAYIFTLLSAVYIESSLHPEH